MADKTTSSKSASKKTDDGDNSAQIASLLDQVRDLMVEDGADYNTAEALTNFARPASPSIVGNYADLQRMGAIAHTGVMPTPPGEDDLETSDINEAFTEPPKAPPAPQPADMVQASANIAKAEEKAK